MPGRCSCLSNTIAVRTESQSLGVFSGPLDGIFMLQTEFRSVLRDTLILGVWSFLILLVFISGWYSIYQGALRKQENLFQAQQEQEVKLLADIFENSLKSVGDYLSLLEGKLELQAGKEGLPEGVVDQHPYVICRGLAQSGGRIDFVQSGDKGIVSGRRENIRHWVSENAHELGTEQQVFAAPFILDGEEVCLGILHSAVNGRDVHDIGFVLVHLSPLIDQYFVRSRGEKAGGAYILGGGGKIVYDQERHRIGKNIFDLHADNPELLDLNKRILSQGRGQGDYHFPHPETGERVRKIAAWNTVDLGSARLVVVTAAAEEAIFAALADMRNRGIALSMVLAFFMIGGLVAYFLYRQLVMRTISRRLEEEVASRTERLRRTKEYLAITLQGIGDGVVSTDESGRVHFMNEVAQSVLGMTMPCAEPFFVQDVGELESIDTGERIEHPVYTALKSRETVPLNSPVRLIPARGSTVSVISGSAAPLMTEGEIKGCVFVFRDITEKYAREEALRQSEAMFRTFTETVDMAILIYSNQKWIYANPAAEELLGYSQDELKHMHCWEVAHPEYRDLVRRRAQGREKGEDIEGRYNIKILTREGEEKTVDFRAQRIHFHGQNAVLTTARDITARLEEEKERDRLEKQLRQAQRLEAVGTLAGGIAHDFNNLLQGMSAHVEYLLHNCDRPDVGQHLKNLEMLVDRSGDLIQRLLVFSRRTEADKKIVSASKVAENALQILRRTIPKMISLQVDLDREEDTLVNGDSGQLEQVLINLIKNAVDAVEGSQEGEVSVSCSRSSLSAVETLSKQLPGGEYVILTVSDTGTGMDRETVEQIFDPFYTTKEVGRGTGLGLAAVYGIVSDHGGGITCYSEPGQGTTFRVYLPAAGRGGDVEPSAGKAASRDLRGSEGLLLVDDEDLILDVTSEMLRDGGYRVFKARSGEEALEIYKNNSQSIDVVILDLGMPGMGGEKCLQSLLGIDRQLKIVVASGYLEHKIKKDPGKYGASAFVGKPYRMDRLLGVLRDVLEENESGG